jgi:hypothetical protein
MTPNSTKFGLRDIRRFSLLGVVYDKKSYLFGIDALARVLEFRLGDTIYVSRYQYENHIKKYEGHHYRGIHLKVQDPDQEHELLKLILSKRVDNIGDLKVDVEFTHLMNCLCRKCKGKGYVDWVEEMVEPNWEDRCSNAELDFTYQKMLLSYIQFDMYSGTAFYRNRNIKNEYIKDCKLCPECSGVGYDEATLERHIPSPIVDAIRYHVSSWAELVHCIEIDPEHYLPD